MSKQDKRLEALQSEAEAIRSRLERTEQDHAGALAELEILRAKAGRGDDKARQAVGKLQDRAQALQDGIKIDRAALADCEADIERARADAEQARKEAAWAELKAALGEVEDLAAELDKDPLDAEKWAALAAVMRRGEQAYQGSLVGEYHTIFTPNVLGAMSGILAYRVKICCMMAAGKKPDPSETMAESLTLAQSRARVENVKP
ncbi:MAG: hypothetical protein JW918_01035 [Anaerolineae bacterium]|nr:hypothetical protein [Anaerolineae bacterium]